MPEECNSASLNPMVDDLKTVQAVTEALNTSKALQQTCSTAVTPAG